MLQSDFEIQTPFRAAVVTMPPDDPDNVSALINMLCKSTDFDVTVLVYNPEHHLLIQPYNLRSKAVMHTFVASEFAEHRRGSMQTHCREVWDRLEDSLSEIPNLKLRYISGRPAPIAESLNQALDLLVAPRAFLPLSRADGIPTDADHGLIKANKMPVFVCANPIRWQRLLIMEATEDRDYGEIPVMKYLLRFLGEQAEKEPPQEVPAIGLHAEDSADESLPITSYGFVDAATVPVTQQKTTVLVASTAITCSYLRHRKLKGILNNWKGGVLVFPSG